MEYLKIQKFSEINLEDPFFYTLKEDYDGFNEWFIKKSNNNALVLYNDSGSIEGFLYCKYENGPGDDTNPLLPDTQHMKVGTFKFNPKQTRRGDRYLKKIFDYALGSPMRVEDIYVTVFAEKHCYLVELFERYGFEKYGVKGGETVLLRNLNKITGDIDKDYPFVQTKDNNKYLLSIYPTYHTRLFPDSKLHSEAPNVVRDISHSNSIHKIYICAMEGVSSCTRGDIIVIYRTGDGQGPAEFRSVATSLCVVEGVRHVDSFSSEEEFVKYCLKFSIFNEPELINIYRQKKYPFIINFTYNIAFKKRPNRQQLADIAGLDRNDYWGVMKLSDRQFDIITELGEIDRRLLLR
ncbi:N-acetyltransferase [Vibrio vulnificus]|nr:N-acetyltransferase [Vibrio vulnificus]EHH2475476.1 N-acetyltransferase [Vibrio vulnificus]EIT6974699.1 N-acetyltransferase [Vibrio vulnificus]EIT6978426.1 N-acetyltransferase [Vibrio vulnificus]EKA6051959.1 N-acetyltransferase [Vibrio vulnificus]